MVLNTIKQKDEMINFLQAHVSQLTQSIRQLALSPSLEEARANSPGGSSGGGAK